MNGIKKFLANFKLLPVWAQWMPMVMVLLVGVTIGALVDVRDLRVKLASASVRPAPTPAPPISARSTFGMSVDELIAAYNVVAKDIDKTILLPPGAAMEDGGHNQNFHALNHAISKAFTVSLEIDNVTGKPFSISLYGVVGAKEDSMTLISSIASIGAAIYGKGSKQLDALIKLCSDTNHDPKQDVQIGGKQVVCNHSEGIWMMVIATPGGYDK